MLRVLKTFSIKYQMFILINQFCKDKTNILMYVRIFLKIIKMYLINETLLNSNFFVTIANLSFHSNFLKYLLSIEGIQRSMTPSLSLKTFSLNIQELLKLITEMQKKYPAIGKLFDKKINIRFFWSGAMKKTY